MQVLVIGGTLFIGPYVVTRLKEMGHEVTLFHRGKTSIDLPPGVEQILGDPALPGTVLRLPMVYGPRDGQHRLFQFGFLKRMDDKRPAILLDESFARWRWARGYVENVAAAIALAVADDRAAGRIYNVGEPETPTMAEWVREIGSGRRMERRSGGFARRPPAGSLGRRPCRESRHCC